MTECTQIGPSLPQYPQSHTFTLGRSPATWHALAEMLDETLVLRSEKRFAVLSHGYRIQ